MVTIRIRFFIFLSCFGVIFRIVSLLISLFFFINYIIFQSICNYFSHYFPASVQNGAACFHPQKHPARFFLSFAIFAIFSIFCCLLLLFLSFTVFSIFYCFLLLFLSFAIFAIFLSSSISQPSQPLLAAHTLNPLFAILLSVCVSLLIPPLEYVRPEYTVCVFFISGSDVSCLLTS